MNRFLTSLLLVLCLAGTAYAQGIKTTALPNEAAPTTDDLMIIVNNPSGSAQTRKVNLQILRGFMLQGDGSSLTGITMDQILTGSLAESRLSFTDITTNNVSTTLHGFAPKAPDDATYYLDGTGAWTIPSTAAAGGFTDAGVMVYNTTSTDNIAFGSTAQMGTAKLSVTGGITATGVITGSSFAGNATTATLATSATALAANGANCSAGYAPLGVNASGAVEGCYLVMTQAAIDTSAELRAILTDETGTGSAVFNTAPTFSGLVTAGSFAGDGSALTGLATSFTDSAGLAAMMDDETGTGLSVFGTSPSFTTKVTMPNAAAPDLTSTNPGEIAFDTNLWATGHGAFVIADGSTMTASVATLVSDTPGDGQVPKWNTGGTITWEDDDDTAAPTIAYLQVAYGSTTDTVGGDTGFTYNPVTNAVTADSFNTTATATPGVTFKDSDASAGDVNAQIAANCTDTGDGTEDCDMTLGIQIAGTLTTALTLNADGNGALASADFGTVAVGSTRIVASGDLVIPNGAAPVVDAAGEIAVDTTDNQLIAYGTTKNVFSPIHEKAVLLEDPSSTTDIDLPLWTPVDGITITSLFAISEGSTATIQITDGTNLMESIIADTDGEADDGSLVNNTFSAGETVRFTVAEASTADWVNTTIRYTVDAQ